MTSERWEQYRQAKEAGDRRNRDSLERAWSRWTGWGPLTMAGLLLGLALLTGVAGLLRFQHDAPLRRAHLPIVTAVVTAVHSGSKRSSVFVRYSAEGREMQAAMTYSGRLPEIGSTISVHYVPGHLQRIRPLGSAWDPGYLYLFLFTGLFLVLPSIVVPLGVLSTRRRIRQRLSRIRGPAGAN